MDSKASSAVILKGIASIANRGKTLKADIQATAAKIVLHAVQHGDVTLADKLIEATASVGLRRDSLVAWFLKHGNMRIVETSTVDANGKTKTTKSFGKDRAKHDTLDKLLSTVGVAKFVGDLVRSEPWDAVKKEKDPMDQETDVDVLVKQFMSKLRKAKTNNNPKSRGLDKIDGILSTLGRGPTVVEHTGEIPFN